MLMLKHDLLFECDIVGIPKPAPRPRAFAMKLKNGSHTARMYAGGSDGGWRADVRQAVLNNFNSAPLAGYVEVAMTFRLPRPASVSPKKRPFPSVRPDLDNLVKSVKDAVKGVLWKDDCQVVRLVAAKVYVKEEYPGLNLQLWGTA